MFFLSPLPLFLYDLVYRRGVGSTCVSIQARLGTSIMYRLHCRLKKPTQLLPGLSHCNAWIFQWSKMFKLSYVSLDFWSLGAKTSFLRGSEFDFHAVFC